MKQVQVAILGLGTVGSGVYRILTDNRKDLMHREQLDIGIAHILVRDMAHSRNVELVPKALLTTDMDDIIRDDAVSIVIECIGGEEPAAVYAGTGR